jgi:hypothetical protein
MRPAGPVKITSGMFWNLDQCGSRSTPLIPAPQAGADEAWAGTLDVAGLCT